MNSVDDQEATILNQSNRKNFKLLIEADKKKEIGCLVPSKDPANKIISYVISLLKKKLTINWH